MGPGSVAAVFFRPGRKDVNPRERALWADLMSLGMVFPIAIALGFFVGRWVGGLLGVPKIGMGLGLVWGVATGFWELYKVTVRLDRFDKAEDGQGDAKGAGPEGQNSAEAPERKDGPGDGDEPRH